MMSSAALSRPVPKPSIRSSRIRTMWRRNLSSLSFAVTGAFGAHADDVVGRINASSEQVLEAIRAQGDSVAVRLAAAAVEAGSAAGAHAEDVVGRITASSTDAVQALRSHGDALAGRLAEAADKINSHGDLVAARLGDVSQTMRGALDDHADDVIGRINTRGAETVEAIRAQAELGRDPAWRNERRGRSRSQRALGFADRSSRCKRGSAWRARAHPRRQSRLAPQHHLGPSARNRRRARPDP